LSADPYYTVQRPGKTNLERAIEFAEEHRAVHLKWIDYWRKYPPRSGDARNIRRAVGGIHHQQIAVRRYDVILRALREPRD
jgi:hypothetical protein